MVEANSLTNEYDIKNNNLAASIEKVQKRLIGTFSSDNIVKGISAFIVKFGVLIGAIKDVNKEFDNQNKITFKSAINNRKLANESQNLLEKYEDLVKEGVTPTKKEKIKLDTITLQLKDRLGDSVIAIDKETGSFKLNTEAVKEQIKLKRLSADEEASTLISRVKGAEQAKNIAEKSIPDLQREFDARKLLAEQAITDFKNSERYQNLNQKSRLAQKSRLPEVIAQRDAFLALSLAKGEVSKQEIRRLDLLRKLKELNFSEEDVNNFFKDKGPKEGDTKFVGNTQFVFKNGKWEAIRVKPDVDSDPDNDDDELTDEDKAIVKSKEKLAEFIKQWHKDQAIQKTLREQGEEAAEIQKKEAEFNQLILDAENDTILKSELEDIKESEIQAIKDKWAEIRLEKLQEEKDKELQINEEQHQKLIAANRALEEAKINIKNQGLSTLQNVFGRENAIAKIAFGLQKAIAINEVLINTKKANAQIVSNLGIANTKAMAASPLTGGLPWTGINIGIAAKHKLANNLNAGAQISGIIGTSIQGFEDGLYTDNLFAVTRAQDGKNFRASFGGNTKSGIVQKPTVFMAGEVGPELIVDNKAFKQINPDIKNSFLREISRVKGFEAGLYKKETFTGVTPKETNVSNNGTNVSNLEMVAALNRASVIFEKLEANGITAYMSNDLRNAKRIQKTLDDYTALQQENRL